MNFDTDQNDTSSSLVAPDNQLNSTINLSIDSKLDNSITNSLTNINDITSKSCNTIENDNQNDKLVNSIKLNDNQVNGLIDNELNLSNTVNQLDNNEISDLIDKGNQFNENNQFKDDNQINNLNETAIEKLGLNLDYYKPTTNINELEKSTLSLLSSLNKSETNSRSNSPGRISQNSLKVPPKRITSEINLLTNEIETKSHNEQLNFFKIERKNLMHLASLILNNLINNISPLTKDLECHNNIALHDFFSITEQILKHGLRGKNIFI